MRVGEAIHESCEELLLVDAFPAACICTARRERRGGAGGRALLVRVSGFLLQKVQEQLQLSESRGIEKLKTMRERARRVHLESAQRRPDNQHCRFSAPPSSRSEAIAAQNDSGRLLSGRSS